MDECAASPGPCDATNGVCTDNEGSYTCTCNTGYVLNGDGSTCDGMSTLINKHKISKYLLAYSFTKKTRHFDILINYLDAHQLDII